MVFIDGGYLRALCKGYFGKDAIHFSIFLTDLIGHFNTLERYPFQANLVRMYYYDAIVVDKKHAEYDAQKEYFEKPEFDDCPHLTIRLGELVESSNKGFKQKGVDTMMAIDALTKAYLDQYDVAIFLVGDRDFIPLIDAVKEAGKKALFIADPQSCSKELRRHFDEGWTIKKEDIANWLTKE